MSGTLAGMMGMGANGAGINGAAGSIPPGLLQMLMARQAMGGGGGVPPGAGVGPPQPGPAGMGAMGGPQLQPGQPPMGGGMNPAAMLPPPQMPQNGPQNGPQVAPGAMAGGGGAGMQGMNAQLPGLLHALMGSQQQGVTPQPGATGAGAQGVNPGLLQMIMQHFGRSGMQGPPTATMNGMGGNITS